MIAAIAYRGRELVRVMAEEVPAAELRYVVPFEVRSRYVARPPPPYPNRRTGRIFALIRSG